MERDDLKCVLIGRNVAIYKDLARLIRRLDATSKFVQITTSENEIKSTLQKIDGSCLIFIFDEVSLSLEKLSDMVWQNSADSSVVIVSTKSKTVSTSRPFNNTQFSRINLNEVSSESEISLQFLIQSYRENIKLRRCKNLLGTAEKRCQWLVDSSREAIAFIARDMHWYANTAYLQLFKVSSLAELRSITVKDIIAPNEHVLFDSFIRENSYLVDTNSTLTISMRLFNGAEFRSQIMLIPSVFKGQKCFQFWVKPMITAESGEKPQALYEKAEELSRDNNIKKLKESSLSTEGPVFSRTTKKQKGGISDHEPNNTKQARNLKQLSAKLAEKLIRCDEAIITVDKLSYLQITSNPNREVSHHQLLSLKVTERRKSDVDRELKMNKNGFTETQLTVFWDKVKFLKIYKSLAKREKLRSMMLVRINQASLDDAQFMAWVQETVLKKLGKKSRHLILLLPTCLDANESKKRITLLKQLKTYGCQIAFDNFISSRPSIAFLRNFKPQYVRLSRVWINQIQGNKTYEARLGDLIAQLQENGIKVIAPCTVNRSMRVFYVNSGVSFCQEIPTEIM